MARFILVRRMDRNLLSPCQSTARATQCKAETCPNVRGDSSLESPALQARLADSAPSHAAQQQPGACVTEDDGSYAQTQWAALINDLKSGPLADRFEHANEYLNAIRYGPATENWESPAYWETPFEFLARGGQCQDYAISKYLAL